MVSNCYAMGSVSGSDEVGGLVGRNGGDGAVPYCYATGKVSGDTNVGGLVGYRSQFAGNSIGFWDTQTTEQATSTGGGTGKLTAEMQMAATFVDAGWDFATPIWTICEGTNYPKLAWQDPPLGDFMCPDGVDMGDFAVLSAHFGETGCDAGNSYCDGVDLDESGTVGMGDAMLFFQNWLLLSVEFPESPSLDAYWPFDEAAGTIAGNASGHAWTGLLRNMSGNEWVAGKFGNALAFDGVNDYVEVIAHPGVTGRQSQTVAAWIKTDSEQGRILSWGDDIASGTWNLRLNSNAATGILGALRISVKNGHVVGTTDLRDNQWHHMAVVLEDDGSPDVAEIQFYVDGVPGAVTHVFPQAINTDDPINVTIGAKHDLLEHFTGLIDEVRIYTRPLSAEEIAQLAQ